MTCGFWDKIRHIYGINKSQSEQIPNFVKLKDYLDNDDTRELYNSLNENVVDYKITIAGLYILTGESDNYSLYTCTIKNENYSGLKTESDSGFVDLKNYNIPIKILDNVKSIKLASRENFFAMTNDNEFYCWGRNDGSSLGVKKSNTPTLYSGSVIDSQKIDDIFPFMYQSYLTTSENGQQSFWVCGTDHVTGATGLSKSCSTWTNFDLAYLGGEKVKSVVSSNAISNYLILTENGNLYTWGIANRIGVNNEDSTIIRQPVKIEGMSDVIQITAGNGYFIAIKKDGSVFGTGSNNFGILGRWKGVGRGDSNSRYKTAFNWVECPELEI